MKDTIIVALEACLNFEQLRVTHILISQPRNITRTLIYYSMGVGMA
jgi:hypothetical protein